MSKDEKKRLLKIFEAMDIDKSGTLSLEELTIGYNQHLGSIISEGEVQELFKKADANNSGTIDWNEFCTIASDKTNLMSNANLKKAFSMFDKDKSGSIDANELTAVLQTFGGHVKAIGNAAEEEKMVANIMEKVDVNKDGVIDF